MKEVYIFTFGIGHQFQNTAVRITAPNYQSARRKMVEKFGLAWAFQYTEENYYMTCNRSGIAPYPISHEFEVTA